MRVNLRLGRGRSGHRLEHIDHHRLRSFDFTAAERTAATVRLLANATPQTRYKLHIKTLFVILLRDQLMVTEQVSKNACHLCKKKERKWTCIVPIVSITRPLSTQMWITQSYLQIHDICLSFVYAFAKGCTAANSFTHLSTDILLIPRPTEGRRLSWPGWLTHSGRLTHEVVTRQP